LLLNPSVGPLVRLYLNALRISLDQWRYVEAHFSKV